MEWQEWVALIARWAHIFAGILWIGQTWYFTWLDLQFEDAEANPGGKVWMVHSGGFYMVDKIKVPSPMPKTLHWFRWEAMLTSMSIMMCHAMTIISVPSPSRTSVPSARPGSTCLLYTSPSPRD